jgi:hypothetical protein
LQDLHTWDLSQVKIFNPMGRLIRQVDKLKPDWNHVDLSHEDPGMYLLCPVKSRHLLESKKIAVVK